MARRKVPVNVTPELPLDAAPSPASDVDAEAVRLAVELAARLAALPSLAAQVATLNAARELLHAVSPFRAEPVDFVRWEPCERVHGNDYNPNKVAPPEMALLRRSIEEDGFTQPVVGWPTPDGAEVVDGFHRSRTGMEPGAIRKRLHGYLPIVHLAEGRHGKGDRIAATIRHNRARGVHGVDPMSDVVRRLVEAQWPDEKIRQELGMDLDEVVRLKQLTGLASLFKDREFSQAWEARLPADDDREAITEEPST